jgi:aspartate/tyrosine/aromatic aminotransferase
MFAYSGMSKDEVIVLREKHHIYCTLDGRISMAVSSLCSFFEKAVLQQYAHSSDLFCFRA